MTITAQATEPLDPQIVDAITEAVRTAMSESSSNVMPLVLTILGTQAVLVGIVFAAVRWLDSRRIEDKQDTKEEFREVKSWIRWLVALHVGKPVGAVTAPPDDADLPELADLRREASTTQAA